MASAYEVASEAVVYGTRLKFTDLCEDVIRLICESLDVESHISLFITVGPIAFGDLYKKIKNENLKPSRVIEKLLREHYGN